MLVWVAPNSSLRAYLSIYNISMTEMEANEGIISEEETNEEITDTPEEQKLKWPAKILHDRNEARAERDERKQKYEESVKGIFRSEQAKQEVQSKLQDLQARIPKEQFDAVKAEMEAVPWLDPIKAYKIVNPDEFAKGKTFDLSGAIPKSISDPNSKPKTVDEEWAALDTMFKEGKLEL